MASLEMERAREHKSGVGGGGEEVKLGSTKKNMGRRSMFIVHRSVSRCLDPSA